MADLLLRIEATFQDNASRGILGLLNPLRFIEGSFAKIGNGIGNLIFGFQNLGTAGTIGMDALKQGAIGVGTGLAQLAVAAAVTAAVIGSVLGVIIGVLAVRAAANFQQGLNRLKTGAGDVTDNMAKMGEGILRVSTDTGVLTGRTDGLNAAMYLIISSGQRGAQALDTLSVAAKGAQIEQAKVTDVANVLSGAMTNYGTKQFNATQFMNGFIVAVQNGKITLQQLAVAMGPIDPIAQQLGIHFNDVAAAMTTQTNAMIPAARAATALRFMMLALENPTKKAKTEMAALGLDSVKVANEMKTSLPGALQMIYNAAKKAGPEGSVPFNRAVGDMVGGIRGLTAFLALTGTHMKDFTKNSAAILAAMKANRDAVIGWDTAQKNFNVQMDRAKAAVQALLINIGTALLPVLTDIVQKLVPIIVKFTDWVIKTHAVENAVKAVVGAITNLVNIGTRVVQFFQQNEVALAALKATLLVAAVIIGVVMVIAFINMAIAAWTAAVAVIAATWPFLLLVVIVIAVVTVIILAIQHWGQIAHWLQGIWAAVSGVLINQWNILKNAAVDVFNRTKQAIIDAFNWCITWIKNAWTVTIAWIVGQWNTLVNAAKDVWGRIGQAINTAVSTVVNAVKNAWNTCVHAVIAAFQWMYDHNYYWKQMVDTAVGTVKGGVALLKNLWNICVNFIKDRWNELANAAKDVWGRTGKAIQDATNTVVNFIKPKWQVTESFLKDRWNELATAATDTWGRTNKAINDSTKKSDDAIHTGWTATTKWLKDQWGRVNSDATKSWADIGKSISTGTDNALKPIHDFDKNFRKIFSDLAAGAVKLGASVINGIADGIRGALGNLASAAQSAAATIAKFLGFHSPTEEGPGKYLDTWGPAMTHGFAQGIVKGIPEVRAAVNMLVTPVGSMSAPVSGGGRSAGSTAGSSGGVTIVIEHIHVNDFGPNMPQTVANQISDKVSTTLASRFRLRYNGAVTGVGG